MGNSNVMYDGHGVESLGDMHQYGNINTEKAQKAKENLANSQDYHFHATIQHLEDGLQEQWKEQNRNMNKNRTNPVSSMSDAKFRKLVTTMFVPVSYNTLNIMAIFFIAPLFFAFKSEGNLINLIGAGFIFILLANILFDAFVIYRARKYVIEKVTNKYYKILKSSWRSYEIIAVMLATGVVILAGLIFAHPDFTTSIDKLNKLLSLFNIAGYAIYSIGIVLAYFVLYTMFVMKIAKDARGKQIESIKEARSGSEHNADVAQSIMDGTLGDFEND